MHGSIIFKKNIKWYTSVWLNPSEADARYEPVEVVKFYDNDFVRFADKVRNTVIELTTERRKSACVSNLRGKRGKLPDDQILRLPLSMHSLVHARHSTLSTKLERNGECLLSAWPEQQVSYWWRHCSRAWELWKMLSQGEWEIPHGKCNKDIRIGENFNWNEAVLDVAQWWDFCSNRQWKLRIPKVGNFEQLNECRTSE